MPGDQTRNLEIGGSYFTEMESNFTEIESNHILGTLLKNKPDKNIKLQRDIN